MSTISSRFPTKMMWLIGAFFYAYQFILRVMPNVMLTDIMNQFHLDTKTFGQFSGVYYIGYCLAHMPIGIMLDRYGPKNVLPVCMLLTVLGSLPILFTDFWVYPIIGRALIGVGSSGAILGAFKIIRLTFSGDKFTRMLSWTVTIGLIGAIYGGGPVSHMCQVWGYQEVVRLFIMVGLVLSVFTYLIVPDIETTESTSVVADIKTVFFNPKVMLVCFLAGLMVGPLEGFADVWGTEFFKQVYGFDAAVAASLPSMIFVGMCFGAPLLSFIAEKSNSYLGTISAAGVIMAISFLMLLGVKMNPFTISLMFVAVGVCCAYQIIAIYKASTYVSENVVGLTTAVANMIIMTFGYFFHSIIGLVIDHFGGIGSPVAFTYGIAIIPVSLIIGALGFLAIIVHERYAVTSI